MIDRRAFRYFDWASFSITMALCIIGLSCVLSATYTPQEHYSLYFKKQLFGVITGFVLYFLFCNINYKTLCRYGYFIFFGVLVLLVFTMIKGSIGMGAKRWIDLGIIKFQPSEIAKLFFPAFIAYYIETETGSDHSIKRFVPALGVLGISTLLILKQPDLGTALILGISGLAILAYAGLNRLFFIISAACCILTAPLLWNGLKEYQQKRILVFLGYGQAQNERYQIEQSKIAIGSGGVWGKGFLKGTQNKYLFLPESRTDFIFSVLAEEWGFAGTCAILILYILLFSRLLWGITTLHNPYAQVLALGLMLHIALSAVINSAMVTGLLPIVGIPLPLMSYGISHMWVTLASLGWLNGIFMSKWYVRKEQ